jgi:hypothetical protein
MLKVTEWASEALWFEKKVIKVGILPSFWM